MQPQVIKLMGSGAEANSPAVVMNWRGCPFQVGMGFNTDGSSTSFKVQYTYDDPQADYPNSYGEDALWFDHATMSGMTAPMDGILDRPVRAIRLSAGATGTDTGTLTIIQAGG